MKNNIIASIQRIEKDLEVYYKYINDPATSKKDRSVVSFKLMNEMIALQTLSDLVPEYVPMSSTGTIMAQGLGGVAGYVSISEGKVVISSDFDAMIAQRDEFLKAKQNG
jgi:hypothetical protein